LKPILIAHVVDKYIHTIEKLKKKW
jgi:hypothetical protein